MVIWDAREKLILASVVNKHGSSNWTNVAKMFINTAKNFNDQVKDLDTFKFGKDCLEVYNSLVDEFKSSKTDRRARSTHSTTISDKICNELTIRRINELCTKIANDTFNYKLLLSLEKQLLSESKENCLDPYLPAIVEQLEKKDIPVYKYFEHINNFKKEIIEKGRIDNEIVKNSLMSNQASLSATHNDILTNKKKSYVNNSIKTVVKKTSVSKNKKENVSYKSSNKVTCNDLKLEDNSKIDTKLNNVDFSIYKESDFSNSDLNEIDEKRDRKFDDENFSPDEDFDDNSSYKKHDNSFNIKKKQKHIPLKRKKQTKNNSNNNNNKKSSKSAIAVNKSLADDSANKFLDNETFNKSLPDVSINNSLPDDSINKNLINDSINTSSAYNFINDETSDKSELINDNIIIKPVNSRKNSSINKKPNTSKRAKAITHNTSKIKNPKLSIVANKLKSADTGKDLNIDPKNNNPDS